MLRLSPQSNLVPTVIEFTSTAPGAAPLSWNSPEQRQCTRRTPPEAAATDRRNPGRHLDRDRLKLGDTLVDSPRLRFRGVHIWCRISRAHGILCGFGPPRARTSASRCRAAAV
jgi:hypothetical protein